ncbi:MAG: flagellar hook-associated protein FlgL [Pseudomonadota bacterium]
MRISTSTAYDRGTAAILRENVDLNKTLLQIATGKRILTPADDPADSARILGLNQQNERTTKFQDNIRAAETNLEIEETTLQSVVDLLQRVRELAVQGSNDTYDADQRKSISFEIKQLDDSLFGYANTVNGQGEYLFAGYKIDTIPFTRGVNDDVRYDGDHGQKNVQIGASRQIATGDNGYDVFMDASGVVGNDGTTKVSLFKVVSDLEETLRTNDGPASGPTLPLGTSPESFHAAMQRNLDNIDIALGKILDIQATIGARQNATQSQSDVNADMLVQIQTTMSETQDLDYATAISRMELQQLGLTAAQQSFTKIQGLSLFNFI